MIRLHRPQCPYPKALADRNYKHPRNKEALRESSSDKCMYCESRITHIDFAHVEHIRPKAEDKYPQLKFDWGNLGYACPKCNNSKGDKFVEGTPYIDPYSEEPGGSLFAFGAFLFHRNGSERGQLTVRDIELNRPELVEKRLQKIEEIGKAIDACFRTTNLTLREEALNELDHEAAPSKEYSLTVLSLLSSNQGNNGDQ